MFERFEILVMIISRLLHFIGYGAASLMVVKMSRQIVICSDLKLSCSYYVKTSVVQVVTHFLGLQSSSF